MFSSFSSGVWRCLCTVSPTCDHFLFSGRQAEAARRGRAPELVLGTLEVVSEVFLSPPLMTSSSSSELCGSCWSGAGLSIEQPVSAGEALLHVFSLTAITFEQSLKVSCGRKNCVFNYAFMGDTQMTWKHTRLY